MNERKKRETWRLSRRDRNRIKDKKNQILDELVEIEQELQERQREDEIVDAEENTMIIAIAAGAGCLLMLSLLLGVACCISRKVCIDTQHSLPCISTLYKTLKGRRSSHSHICYTIKAALKGVVEKHREHEIISLNESNLT